MDGSCSTHGTAKKYIQNVGQKPEGKRSIGRHRHIWEDNIKMDFREISYNVDWILLAQEKGQWLALMNTVMILQVP
jgi:hypothetical protein